MSNLQPSSKKKRSVLRFVPGLQVLSEYKRSWLASDLGAGLSVAAIALPVGIAYADLAGVPPVIGIYSAVFPLLAYSLFGSSRQLMTGPDAATCIIVAASLGPLAGGDPERYLALMVTMSLFTGVLYIIGGFSKLGFISNFLSQPILTGYLNGISCLIVVGQMRKLFGFSGEAGGFFSKLLEFVEKVPEAHLPTLALGAGMLVLLVLLRRFVPKLPGALVVVAAGAAAVIVLKLKETGVTVIGEVPAGLPTSHFAVFKLETYRQLLGDASGIVLISFTSGVLTAKSFARRNRYEIDANQELIAFGACNLASGLAQGFPVTGADSRTAVNDAMGGKSQLVGITAAVTMLAILFFLTAPLASVPNTALAAVIIISGIGLFDLGAVKTLYRTSQRELLLCVTTTLGVLILGVLPGVFLAVLLSLIWLLSVGSKPACSTLGKVPGKSGYHDLTAYPDAVTMPGLLLFRFESSPVFFNADYFKDQVKAMIANEKGPVETVVVDASPFNVVDATALSKIDELRTELHEQGITLAFAGMRHSLSRFFKDTWARERGVEKTEFNYTTLDEAVTAFGTNASEDSLVKLSRQ